MEVECGYCIKKQKAIAYFWRLCYYTVNGSGNVTDNVTRTVTRNQSMIEGEKTHEKLGGQSFSIINGFGFIC